MLRINLGRVTIGGLLAGLIINIGEYVLHGVLIAEEMNAAMAALNRPPIAPAMITWFVVLTYLESRGGGHRRRRRRMGLHRSFDPGAPVII